MELALVELAHGVITTALGRSAVISRLDRLPATGGGVVLDATLADSRRFVLKVADHGDESADFQRTQAVIALASAAGVPAPAVLAAENSGYVGRRYLLLEHVDGVPWHRVRPSLDARQLSAGYEQIADAVLALQSVRFGSFGELDRRAEPAGQTLLAALHHRAELRIPDARAREEFSRLLDRDAHLFTSRQSPTLCHDDLHHGNLLFREQRGHWDLAAVLDWDKAWAGPAECDIARMEFWDDMTGPGYWRVYRSAVPAAEGHRKRSLIYQLLWCLEYQSDSARHAADTAALARRLGLSGIA